MAFKPLTMDGQAAAKRMLSWGTYRAHACLAAVHNAFPFAKSDKPGAYTSARVQWERTPQARRHPGDRGVPAGALVFFDLYVNDTKDPRPGHVGISLGGDRFVSTDWPSRGKVGIARIGEIEAKWKVNRAKYLGWTDVVGGHNVTVGPDPDAQPAGVAFTREQVVIAERGLNLRAAASTSSKSLMVIPHGAIVKTGRVSGKWEQTLYAGKTGWVHSDWIIWVNRTVVAKRGLNVRKTPSILGKRIGGLVNGTKVRITNSRGKWRYITAGAVRGWVHQDYLK